MCDGRTGAALDAVVIELARRFDAEVELRRRVKEAFEREGIAMAGADRVIYVRSSSSPEVKA